MSCDKWMVEHFYFLFKSQHISTDGKKKQSDLCNDEKRKKRSIQKKYKKEVFPP